MKIQNVLLGVIALCLVSITSMMVVEKVAEHQAAKVIEMNFRTDFVPILDHVWVGEGAYGSEGYIVQEPDGSYRFVSTFNQGLSLDAKFLKRMESPGNITYSPVQSTTKMHELIREYDSGGKG